MSTILPLFGKLSSAKSTERLDATAELVASATALHHQFSVPEIGTNSIPDVELEQCIAPDVLYTLRRLTRGLASSRESSRLGFAVALTELLSKLNTVTVGQILALIQGASDGGGSSSGQEERDLLLAHLFGLTCLVQSGMLFRRASVSWSTTVPVSNKDDFVAVVSQLLSIGERKTWISEGAWWSLCEALVGLCESHLPWKEEALSASLNILLAQHQKWSPEKVALVIKLQPLCPNQPWADLLQPTFKKGSILSEKNRTSLAAIICEVTSPGDSYLAALDGPWKRPLHFVWQSIIDLCLNGGKGPVNQPSTFIHIWKEIVSDILLAPSSSATRRYTGFQILRRCLTRMADTQVTHLFTKNVMQTWMTSLSDGDKHMHQIACLVAEDIQTLATKRSKIVLPLVHCLLGINGSPKFDRVTRTKIVENLLTVAEPEDVADYANSLLTDLKNPAHSGKDGFVPIMEQLETLLRNSSIAKTRKTVELIVECFVEHGWFAQGGPEISDDLRLLCRSRLLLCLGDLCSSHHKSSVANSASDSPHYWIQYATSVIDKKEQDISLVTSTVNKQLASRSRKLEKKLRQNERASTPTGRSIALLLSGTRLQVLQGFDDEVVATLEACCDLVDEHIKSNSSQTTSLSARALDIIISLLESESSYCRKFSTKAFELIMEDLDDDAVDLLVAQLDTSPDDEEGSDDDEDSEMEVVSSDEEESEGSLSDTSSSLSDPNDDDDLVLRSSLKEALGEFNANSSDDDSEEELLDDDAMLALDEKISAAFKMQHQSRGGGKAEVERKALHFRNRVLDLVDAFLKSQPSNPRVHIFILPMLVSATQSSKTEKEFSDKLSSIIRSRFGKAKIVALDEAETMKQTLLELHEMAEKSTSSNQLYTIGCCCVYISRGLVDVSQQGLVAKTYGNSLKAYSQKKGTQLNPAFFTEICKRLPEVGWMMRDDVLDAYDIAINAYRRTQMLQLASTIITQHQLDEGQIPSDDLNAFLEKLVARVCSLIEHACMDDPSKTASAAQLKDVCKAANKMALQISKSKVKGVHWDIDRLARTEISIAESERLKSSGVAKMWRSFLELIRRFVKTESPDTVVNKPKKHLKRKGTVDGVGEQEAELGGSKKKARQGKKV